MTTTIDAIAAKPSAGRLTNCVVIAVFALIVLAPATAQLFALGNSGSRENRTLAPPPRIETIRHLNYLPKMLEDYVNDRFGLRQVLVRAWSLARYQVGLSSTKDVVIGKDGWLFYTAERLMEQHTGADVFKPAELEAWIGTMERTQDWLAARGIAFYILIAPDKNTMYPELLPNYPRRKGGTTRTDQLVARARSSTLEVIDPRPALFAAKAAGKEIYFAGDSHWTERGAFVAYTALMDRIRQRFPDVAPLTEADYETTRGRPAASDLARMLSLEDRLSYEIERLKLRDTERRTALPVTTMRQGWGWRVERFTNNLAGRPKLLVFGDSFTNYVLGPNMLYATFRDAVWTHNNGGTLNLDLVAETKPDIVLVQMADRYLRIRPQTPFGMD